MELYISLPRTSKAANNTGAHGLRDLLPKVSQAQLGYSRT